MKRMTFSMTTSNEKETVTMGDHVRETHREKLVEAKKTVGQVVTGDAVSGEVRKNEQSGDDN